MFSFLFCLACVFSFAHRLRVCSFPLFYLCKFSSHYIGDCVCCGLVDVGYLLISTFVNWVFLCPRWEFGFFPNCGLRNAAIVSLGVCGCWCTLVLGCCWVVLATLGPRTTLSCLVDLNCVSPFVWDCHLVVFNFFTDLWMGCFAAVCSGWSLECCEWD